MTELNSALGAAQREQGVHSSSQTKETTTFDQQNAIRRVVSYDEAWPEPKETPYFNHAVYYSSLREYRATDPEAEEWGDVLLYGEVVTSTNTLLEK